MTSTSKGLPRRILETLDRQRKPVSLPRLANILKCDADDAVFLETVTNLRRSGKVYAADGRSYASVTGGDTVLGALQVADCGFGFVTPDSGGPDIHISGRHMADAINGDVVLVQLMRRRGPRGLVGGKILGVAERPERPLVGTVQLGPGFAWLQPDGGRLQDIQLFGTEFISVSSGQKVAARLQDITPSSSLPMAEIERVLGNPSDPAVAIEGIIHRYNLRDAHSSAAEAEVLDLQEDISDNELDYRQDLRSWQTVTIDPANAADIDDAVSFTTHDHGGGTVGIHIADVSHFVTVGGEIDREAVSRGTSVYLPGRVLHMLPRGLSQNRCSLLPGKNRLAVSVLVHVDGNGNVRGSEIAHSIIRSDAQLNYQDVQAVLSGTADTENPASEFASLLSRLAAFTDRLTEERLRDGALDFDLPEIETILDDDGSVSELRHRERLKSHRLVEELMLLANRIVARFLGRKHVDLLYRVHASPDPEKLKSVIQLASVAGHPVNLRGKAPTARELQSLLESLENTPYVDVLQLLVIRSFPKALYQPGNIGHFGLAAREYCHFTSPIRRYPDLIVHRQLTAVLRGTTPVYTEFDLDELGRITSDAEQNAERAEREALRILQAEYLSVHVGEVFHGVVSGALRSGLFVTLFDILVEGFVRTEDLPPDSYRFDTVKLRLLGRHSGMSHGFGDHVVVQIAGVDTGTGKIDLLLIENRSSRKRGKVVSQSDDRERKPYRRGKHTGNARRQRARGMQSSGGTKKSSRSGRRKRR